MVLFCSILFTMDDIKRLDNLYYVRRPVPSSQLGTVFFLCNAYFDYTLVNANSQVRKKTYYKKQKC